MNFLEKYSFLDAYNPWWADPAARPGGVPSFRRDVFADLYSDIKTLPQMVSVTGPRRVGKSTLLRQSIDQLIRDNGPAQARRILYFALDDPALSLPDADPHRFFEDMVAWATVLAKDGPVFLFLDEIQRLPRWELYLKKHYDLKAPLRFVISGSASTPIFRQSRESLLGRVKTYHLLPFSFREFFCFAAWSRMGEYADAGKLATLSGEVNEFSRLARTTLELRRLLELLTQPPIRALSSVAEATKFIERYFVDGGFPEVWEMADPLRKQDYLYQNQVERVIFEDLLVAAEFRKPELLRRFYLGLLASPGRETNMSRLQKEIALDARTVGSYFPLLEATDLVWRLHKYSGSRSTVKAGNFKSYLVDLAVRNAVLKLSSAQLLGDDATLGLYAENIVANHLRRWPGLVELAYYRQNNAELDFVLDLGPARVAVEVKYRNRPDPKEIFRAARLAAQIGCEALIVVARDREGIEVTAPFGLALPVAVVPFVDFVLMF